MPQGFYRPISLQALQIECEYGEIEDKFREFLPRSCHSEFNILLRMKFWKTLFRRFPQTESDLYAESH